MQIRYRALIITLCSILLGVLGVTILSAQGSNIADLMFVNHIAAGMPGETEQEQEGCLSIDITSLGIPRNAEPEKAGRPAAPLQRRWREALPRSL